MVTIAKHFTGHPVTFLPHQVCYVKARHQPVAITMMDSTTVTIYTSLLLVITRLEAAQLVVADSHVKIATKDF